MARQKTVYSVWYRKLLKKQRQKQLAKDRAQAIKDEETRQKYAEANAEKERQLEVLRKQRDALRQERTELIQQGGMKRDTRLEADFDAMYIPEGSTLESKLDDKAKRKRLKEQERLQKEKQKALAALAKEEKEFKSEKEEIVDYDEKTRIEMDHRLVDMMRERDDDALKTKRDREKIRNKELKIRQKQEAILTAEENKKLELEYQKQERLRKEEEEAERKILAKRRKAAGNTWQRRMKEKMRRFSRIYSFQNLKDTINTYGYSYDFKDFAKTTAAIVLGVSIIAYYSKLRGGYLFAIIAATILSIPFLTYSWFNQQYAGKKFEMVQSYVSNILPIFMQKPKIRYALQEVMDMSDGQMKNAIQHAIDYIDTASSDEDVMKTGLSFIETEFPNSRIKAVHKLLLDIESGNSKDYTDICENMYTDVEAWIRRVYSFQKELKSRRSSLIILCVFSMVLNLVFTAMYGSNEIFDGFTDRALYQWSTMLFIGLTLITIALIMTKMHGSWLVYDSDEKEEIENIRAYTYINMNTDKPKKQDIMVGILLAITGLILVFVMNNRVALVLFPLAWFSVMRQKMKWNTKFKRVAKTLMLEFPVWLRGVSLNLHEMTVVNAIRESQKSCSYCMAKEIDKFFEIYDENPTSIKAFNDFLKEYKLEDVQASMKVLFTIQSMSAEEIKNQVAMIINRNQELLTKTETIRNQDALGAAEMLGYAPMVLLTVQLLMSMMLMFLHIMEYMDMIMATSI